MTVRFLGKVDLGEGVGGYEFALDDRKGTGSKLYDAGSRIYESLLRSSDVSSKGVASPPENDE